MDGATGLKARRSGGSVRRSTPPVSFAHPMIGQGSVEAVTPPRMGRFPRNGHIPHLRRQEARLPTVTRSAPVGVERSLITGIVLLARGDVRILSSDGPRAQDISAVVARTWFNLAYEVCISGERDSKLRSLERIAGRDGSGWQYRAPTAARELFNGARARFDWLEINPKAGARLVHSIVVLAAHLPNPLQIRTRDNQTRKLGLPIISGAQAELVEELVGEHLCDAVPLRI